MRTQTAISPSAALLAALLIATAARVHAQQEVVTATIWSCRDAAGRTLLTSLKEDTVGRDCRVVQQQRLTVVPAPPAPKPGAKTATPTSFPRETPAERASARERQRQTLERELSQEQRLLSDAQRRLSEQEALGAHEAPAKAQERLQPYRDTVEVHAKNVEALKRELANLGR